MSAPRIIVVEDERIVALNLRQRLTKLGYDVAAMATSGDQALQEIRRVQPDVVLMDINIEGDIDGIETASRIPKEFQTPVIYLTAYSEQATLERAKATNPYGYLLKPFSERELHATIQMVLARRVADVTARRSEQRLEKEVSERTAELKAANDELKIQAAERAKIEEALVHAQKMEAIGQLTGGIAHDFNNLLQGILGALSIVQKRIARRELGDLDHLIGGAVASAQRAGTLTHRLLAFSRRQPLQPKAVHCSRLVDGMRGLIERTVGESIRVQMVADDDLWLARCDESQLESALLNLAINARDAMPAGGRLTVDVRNHLLDADLVADRLGLGAGPYVKVAITDTGCGMSPATAARAFEPFFTTKPIGQGTGLGLSMVYGFARQSRGTATVHSELERGTTINIYLPKFVGEPAVDPADAGESVEPPGQSVVGKMVLVVEDDVVVREVVVNVLKELGCRTLEAVDGPGGVEILRSDRAIDLLITDIGLPGLNGRQVADAGRSFRPELKVLFMTGYVEKTLLKEGMFETGVKMITKPFSLDALAKYIMEILGQREVASIEAVRPVP